MRLHAVRATIITAAPIFRRRAELEVEQRGGCISRIGREDEGDAGNLIAVHARVAL